MGEETWSSDVVRSKRIVDFDSSGWKDWMAEALIDEFDGPIVHDGPRPAICADCGKAPENGLLIHLKPETYAVRIESEVFFLERHIGVACGCAAKRGLV